MALSYIEYDGDGSTTTFTTPKYLQRTHLVVTIGGEPTNDYTLINESLTFNTAPPSGSTIRIGRNSNQSARLTDYVDGSLLTANVMDDDANQLFFMAQEAIDTASETNLAASTFYSSGSTAPSSPSLGSLFFNTTSGVLQVYSAGGWVTVNNISTSTTFTSPTTGERTFTTSATLGVNTQVFLNGVKLVEGATNDYTLDGASVVLEADDPTSSYILEVINQ